MPEIDPESEQRIALAAVPGCRAWIDGVGCWLIWFRDSLVIGNVTQNRDDAYRLRFATSLRSRHLVWKRKSGVDWIEPLGTCRINGLEPPGEQMVHAGDELRLADDLGFQFERPSPLSESTVLRFQGQRTVDHLDGVVLFHQTCLIGTGNQVHISARGWAEPFVLFEREGELWWRTPNDPQFHPVFANAVCNVGQWRLRFEPVTESK